MTSRWIRNSFIYLLILVAVIAIVVSFFRPPSGAQSEDLSWVVDQARAGNVASIEAQGDSLTVHLKDNQQTYKSRKESGASLVEVLRDNGVEVGGADGGAGKGKGP